MITYVETVNIGGDHLLTFSQAKTTSHLRFTGKHATPVLLKSPFLFLFLSRVLSLDCPHPPSKVGLLSFLGETMKATHRQPSVACSWNRALGGTSCMEKETLECREGWQGTATFLSGVPPHRVCGVGVPQAPRFP